MKTSTRVVANEAAPPKASQPGFPPPAALQRAELLNFYFKLSTKYHGPGKKLDVNSGGSDENFTLLRNEQNLTGQFWRFRRNPDGSYRMSSWYQGTTACLGTGDDGKGNTRPKLVRCADGDGQKWRLVQEGAWVRIKNVALGEDKCLDIYNPDALGPDTRMHPCGTITNQEGQFWLISRTEESVQ